MPAESARSLYASGLAAFRSTSFETAHDLFTRAIDLEPSSAKLYDARASVSEKLGHLQDGLQDAKQVVVLMPDHPKGYLRAARLLKAAKKYANAEKILVQGLAKVSQAHEKGLEALRSELSTLRKMREQAEFCPFSTLPLEIFLEIITLATVPPPISKTYRTTPIPRTRLSLRGLSPLYSAMSVCRTWRRTILGSPRFWQTLRIDGAINAKSAEKKTKMILRRAMGRGDECDKDNKSFARRSTELDARTTALGVQRIVLTAAQDLPSPALANLLELISEAGATSTLRQVVVSFIDGSTTTLSNEREGIVSTQLLRFLHSHASRTTLECLSVCTTGRCYPDFDLQDVFAQFPKLAEFNVWANATSGFVLSLRAPFLRTGSTLASPSPRDVVSDASSRTPSPPPPAVLPNARSLTMVGSVLVTDSPAIPRTSFPNLESLDLNLIGAPVIWDLLSIPNVRRFHAVLLDDVRSAGTATMPDLEQSWARLEHLRLGGIKSLPGRFLNEAIRLDLSYRHLVEVDLTFCSIETYHVRQFGSDRAPSLEVLNLASTTIPPSRTTNASSRRESLELPVLGQLRSLDLSHTLWTTDVTVEGLKVKTPRLERLKLVGNAFVTGKPLMELVHARRTASEDDSDVDQDESSLTDAPVLERIHDRPRANRVDDAKTQRPRYSALVELRLEGCDKIETAAVEWLRRNVRPGGVKFQFVDPNEKRNGFRAGGRWA
ncbi:hypothetical protein JCM10212_006374 [Sporobolomyces blumeae]